MNPNADLTRRDCLAGTVAVAVTGGFALPESACAETPEPKKVAAIITAYEEGLHADVLVGKIASPAGAASWLMKTSSSVSAPK